MGKTALDVLGFIPGLDALKYADEAVEAVQTIAKHGGTAVEAVQTIAKHGGKAADALQGLFKQGNTLVEAGTGLGFGLLTYGDEAIEAGQGLVKHGDEALEMGEQAVKHGQGVAGGAGSKPVYSANGNSTLRASRRPAFDNMRNNGIEVNGTNYKISEHAYNSAFKSGRKDIMPDDVCDALKVRPVQGTTGSVRHVNPTTGTKVFVNPITNEIIGIWPAGFRE